MGECHFSHPFLPLLAQYSAVLAPNPNVFAGSIDKHQQSEYFCWIPIEVQLSSASKSPLCTPFHAPHPPSITSSPLLRICATPATAVVRCATARTKLRYTRHDANTVAQIRSGGCAIPQWRPCSEAQLGSKQLVLHRGIGHE